MKIESGVFDLWDNVVTHLTVVADHFMKKFEHPHAGGVGLGKLKTSIRIKRRSSLTHFTGKHAWESWFHIGPTAYASASHCWPGHEISIWSPLEGILFHMCPIRNLNISINLFVEIGNTKMLDLPLRLLSIKVPSEVEESLAFTVVWDL